MTCILGIETSCDETAAAVIDSRSSGTGDLYELAGTLVTRSNVVASQTEVHSRYGGVFPEVASRMHVEAIWPVVQEAMQQASITPANLDAVAVTRGPGLAGSLLVGVNFAKGLALSWNKPLLGINHLEGHIYSLWLTEHAAEITFPAVCLLVSGGHTELLLMDDHLSYKLLGGTLDDAAGEAFDKVGRVLGLPYPGGPAIERAAREGNPSAYPFTRPMLGEEHAYSFSFSGIKTAVMRAVQPPATGRRAPGGESLKPDSLRPDVVVADVAASFQAVAVDMLVEKTVRAAQAYDARAILIAGGVSANSLLRQEMRRRSALPVYYPPLWLCTDNAAMIAAAAQYRFRAGQRDNLALDVLPMLPLIQPLES